MTTATTGLSGAQRRAVAANGGILVVATTVGGDVFQVYAHDVLGLSAATVGLILGAQLVSVPIQVHAAAISLTTPKRMLMVRGHRAILVAVGLLALAPALPTAWQGATVAVVAAAALLAECGLSYGWGTAWQAWMQALTSAEDRGRVLARMRSVAQGAALAFTLSATALAGARMSYARFLLLVTPVLGYLFVALRLYARLPEPRAERKDAGAGLVAVLRRLLSAPDIRRLTQLLALTELLGPPLLVTYLIEVAELPSSIAIAIALGRQVASLLTLGRVGRAVDRYRPVPVMRCALVATALLSGAWVTCDAAGWLGTSVPVLAALVLGLTLALNTVSFAALALAHETAPAEDAAVAFSFYDLLESSATQLLAAGGGILVAMAAGGARIGLGGVSVDVYTLWIALGGAVALLARRLAR